MAHRGRCNFYLEIQINMSTLYAVVVALAVLSGPMSPVDAQEKQTRDQYQQAISLLQSSRTIRDAGERNKQIDRAQVLLEQFVANNSRHLEFAQANAQLAQILLDKARTAIVNSESATGADRKMKDRQQARELLGSGRQYFQVAHDLYQQQYKAFPVFIDRQTDPDKYAARRKAEMRFFRSQLNLPICDLEESHTYDESDPKFKKLLANAATEFEKIHAKYRSLVAGLYARLLQAKCLQEAGSIRKALGIYGELLSHPGSTRTLQTLQDQARHFRLICLNHDQRKDHVLVIREATEWFEAAKERSRTTTGLGIRWELALAQEQRSKQTDVQEEERKQLQQSALENARLIARFASRYKEKAQAMIARLATEDE
jgi:hypothetical protein